jgi:hypothetical protein
VWESTVTTIPNLPFWECVVKIPVSFWIVDSAPTFLEIPFVVGAITEETIQMLHLMTERIIMIAYAMRWVC